MSTSRCIGRENEPKEVSAVAPGEDMLIYPNVPPLDIIIVSRHGVSSEEMILITRSSQRTTSYGRFTDEKSLSDWRDMTLSTRIAILQRTDGSPF